MTDKIKAKIETFKDWLLNKTLGQYLVFWGFFLFWDVLNIWYGNGNWKTFLALITILPVFCLIAVFLIDTYDYR